MRTKFGPFGEIEIEMAAIKGKLLATQCLNRGGKPSLARVDVHLGPVSASKIGNEIAV